MKTLTSNWIGAIIGGVAGILLAKKFAGGGAVTSIVGAGVGAVAGALGQKTFAKAK